MGHLLSIQVQLFLLEKLKAAGDRPKTSTTTHFECIVFIIFLDSSPGIM